jgi:short-subunit dehydrogenase
MSTSLFAGTWALVTGASSGLGAELARSLAHRGANLVLTARSEDRLVELANDLRRVNGIETHVISNDLGVHGGAERLLQRVTELGVPVAHLINNAGFGSAGALSTLDPKREDEMVRLNTGAVVTLTRGLLPGMLAARRGGIINVASTAGLQPVPFMATYGATKAFVVSFTLALAEELKGTGVRALVLCPGPVLTGFQAAAGLARPGMKLAVLTAQKTVENGLAAYERGDRRHVPGLVNTLHSYGTRVAPERFVTWFTARAMRRWNRA